MSTQDRPEESPLTAATVSLPRAEVREREAQSPTTVALPELLLAPASLPPPPLASAPTQRPTLDPQLKVDGASSDPSTSQSLPPLPSSPSLTLASPHPVSQSESGEEQSRGGREGQSDTHAIAGSTRYGEDAKDQGQSRQVLRSLTKFVSSKTLQSSSARRVLKA